MLQKTLPNQEAADKYVANSVESRIASLDANDLLYQVNASRNYDPSPRLETIIAPVMWINSADDFINPPELGIAEKQSKRLPNGTFLLIPIGENTHGHGTHTWAVVWQEHLRHLLSQSAH